MTVWRLQNADLITETTEDKNHMREIAIYCKKKLATNLQHKNSAKE